MHYGCGTGMTYGYGYGAPMGVAPTRGLGGFALIVVLFILLIIVGTSWM